jgi:hypothetical protein
VKKGKGAYKMAKRPGRPKSNNPRSFTIPEIRMNREEYIMTVLKAALYHGGSTAALMRHAVRTYTKEIPVITCSTPGCGGEMQVIYRDEEFSYDVAGSQHIVKVNKVPAYQCRDCGAIEENLILMANLEELVGDELHWRLNHREDLPSEICFTDFSNI